MNVDRGKPTSGLVDATDNLAERVDRLTQSLKLSKQQVFRMRILTIFAVVVSVVALVGGFMLWDLSRANEDAVNAIKTNAKTACENGNKSREGQRLAWGELLSVSTASLNAQAAAEGHEPPQAVLDYYAAYKEWIDTQVFIDRDCDNLDTEYKEPGPAPSFKEALEESIREQTEG